MPVAGHFAGRRAVRWGILGCGDVTEVKSGPGFRKAAGSELVAVMRRNGALARDYAQRHGVAQWYDSAQALIEDPGVDAVYIATMPDTHCDYALAAAAAGKPALVEKPMARNTAECDRMVAAFAAAGLPLYVAYYYRSLPYIRKVAELLQAGAIGRVSGVTYRMVEPHHRRAPMWRIDAALAGIFGRRRIDCGGCIGLSRTHRLKCRRKTWRTFGADWRTRSVLECASPLALCEP